MYLRRKPWQVGAIRVFGIGGGYGRAVRSTPAVDTRRLSVEGAALKGLLTAEDAEGWRILYQEDAGEEHGYCQVCREVAGHRKTVQWKPRRAFCASCKGPRSPSE